MKKCLRIIGIGFVFMLVLVFSLWVFGELTYDGPGLWPSPVAMLGLLAAMICLKFRRRAGGVCVAAVFVWWLSLKPPANGKCHPSSAIAM